MAELIKTSLDGSADLLAYYRFNSSALITDSSGNSRTLTNNNTVGETINGKYGYAADYGDPNTNKYFGRAEDVWNNGAFSFAAWVKVSDLSLTNGFCNFRDAGTNKQLRFSRNTDGTLAVSHFRVGVATDTITSTGTIDNNWHHVAFTLTTGAGGTVKIYINGNEDGSGSVVNSSGSVGQADQYEIGGDGGQAATLKGFMDDVALFNRVLTGAEVKELSVTYTLEEGYAYFM